jgi:hypothetical protein
VDQEVEDDDLLKFRSPTAKKILKLTPLPSLLTPNAVATTALIAYMWDERNPSSYPSLNAERVSTMYFGSSTPLPTYILNDAGDPVPVWVWAYQNACPGLFALDLDRIHVAICQLVGQIFPGRPVDRRGVEYESTICNFAIDSKQLGVYTKILSGVYVYQPVFDARVKELSVTRTPGYATLTPHGVPMWYKFYKDGDLAKSEASLERWAHALLDELSIYPQPAIRHDVVFLFKQILRGHDLKRAEDVAKTDETLERIRRYASDE